MNLAQVLKLVHIAAAFWLVAGVFMRTVVMSKAGHSTDISTVRTVLRAFLSGNGHFRLERGVYSWAADRLGVGLANPGFIAGGTIQLGVGIYSVTAQADPRQCLRVPCANKFRRKNGQ